MSKRLGILGVGFTALSLIPYSTNRLERLDLLSIFAQFAAMLLFIWAGVTGSRWWLAGGVAYAGYFGFFLWVLSRGH